MGRHSRRVQEVTRACAEAAPEGMGGGDPRPGDPTADITRVDPNERNDSSKGEPMPPNDLLSALLDPVCAATHDDSTQAHDMRNPPTTRSVHRAYQRVIARAPGVLIATVDRLCRYGGVPIVHAHDVWLFDVVIVGSSIRGAGSAPVNAPCADRRVGAAAEASGVRRVLREIRHRGTCDRRRTQASTDFDGYKARRSPQPS
jgi:hypothetical protein